MGLSCITSTHYSQHHTTPLINSLTNTPQEDISVGRHLKALEKNLGRALQLDPVHINVHAGSDSWCVLRNHMPSSLASRHRSDAECDVFYGHAVEVQRRVCGAVPVSHETHRGRALFNPFRAHVLLKE